MASKFAQNHAQMPDHKVIMVCNHPSCAAKRSRDGCKPQSKRNIYFLTSTSFFSHSNIRSYSLSLATNFMIPWNYDFTVIKLLWNKINNLRMIGHTLFSLFRIHNFHKKLFRGKTCALYPLYYTPVPCKTNSQERSN